MFIVCLLFIYEYYFIKIKNSELAILSINIILILLILSSVIINTFSPINSIFYKELNTEYFTDNLTDISYKNTYSEPHIYSVTNVNGNVINLNPNNKIGIISEPDDDITDNIRGKLETIKINYELNNLLAKWALILQDKKQVYIYNVISFENYN